MKDNMDTTSEGLNQIFEIINAKGDIGEINEIIEQSNKEVKRDSDTFQG